MKEWVDRISRIQSSMPPPNVLVNTVMNFLKWIPRGSLWLTHLSPYLISYLHMSTYWDVTSPIMSMWNPIVLPCGICTLTILATWNPVGVPRGPLFSTFCIIFTCFVVFSKPHIFHIRRPLHVKWMFPERSWRALCICNNLFNVWRI